MDLSFTKVNTKIAPCYIYAAVAINGISYGTKVLYLVQKIQFLDDALSTYGSDVDITLQWSGHVFDGSEPQDQMWVSGNAPIYTPESILEKLATMKIFKTWSYGKKNSGDYGYVTTLNVDKNESVRLRRIYEVYTLNESFRIGDIDINNMSELFDAIDVMTIAHGNDCNEIFNTHGDSYLRKDIAKQKYSANVFALIVMHCDDFFTLAC